MPTLTSEFQEIFGLKAFRNGATVDGGDVRFGAFRDPYAVFLDWDKDLLGFFTRTPVGKVDAAPDTDNYFRFGRAWFSYDGTTSDAAGFGHVDWRDSTSYAISQGAGGNVAFNAPTGLIVTFRVAGTQYGQLNATRWDFNATNLDHDYRIRGDSVTNLFYVDASTDRIGVNTASPNTTFHIAGGFSLGTIAKSGNYIMLSTDYVVFATGGVGGITITLPAATNTGQIVEIIKVDSGAGAVTVSRAGSDTIEGGTTKSLATQYDKTRLIADGSATWYDEDTGLI